MAKIPWSGALERAIREKDEELNARCSKEILDGFIHNIEGIDYWFSYDIEAQLNMQGIKKLLDEGVIQSKRWTVRIGGKDGEYSRVDVTKPIMDSLSLTALQHVDEKVSRYRDFLLPKVSVSTTPEEVAKYTWEYEEPVPASEPVV